VTPSRPRCSAISLTARRPRGASGRSWSITSESSQLDFAWRRRNSCFTWVRCLPRRLTRFVLRDERVSPLGRPRRLLGTSSRSAGGDRCPSTEAVLRDRPVNASVTVGLDEMERRTSRASPAAGFRAEQRSARTSLARRRRAQAGGSTKRPSGGATSTGAQSWNRGQSFVCEFSSLTAAARPRLESSWRTGAIPSAEWGWRSPLVHWTTKEA
jgi:hypothetical protein